MSQKDTKYVVYEDADEARVFDSEDTLEEYFEEEDDNGSQVQDFQVYELGQKHKIVSKTAFTLEEVED